MAEFVLDKVWNKNKQEWVSVDSTDEGIPKHFLVEAIEKPQYDPDFSADGPRGFLIFENKTFDIRLPKESQQQLKFLRKYCANGGLIELFFCEGYAFYGDEEGRYKHKKRNRNLLLLDLLGDHDIFGNVFLFNNKDDIYDGEDSREESKNTVEAPYGISKELFLEYFEFQELGLENPLMLMVHKPTLFTPEIMTRLTKNYTELKALYVDKMK